MRSETFHNLSVSEHLQLRVNRDGFQKDAKRPQDTVEQAMSGRRMREDSQDETRPDDKPRFNGVQLRVVRVLQRRHHGEDDKPCREERTTVQKGVKVVLLREHEVEMGEFA